jgi:hypothetical protein
MRNRGLGSALSGACSEYGRQSSGCRITPACLHSGRTRDGTIFPPKGIGLSIASCRIRGLNDTAGNVEVLRVFGPGQSRETL